MSIDISLAPLPADHRLLDAVVFLARFHGRPVERAALADTLRKQGRASIRLNSESLLAEGGVAASFVGRYVAILRSG